jgi:hypothetical protein
LLGTGISDTAEQILADDPVIFGFCMNTVFSGERRVECAADIEAANNDIVFNVNFRVFRNVEPDVIPLTESL